MLGLGQSLSHGGAPSETPFKLTISTAKLLVRPNDAFFAIRCKLTGDTPDQVGQSTQGAHSRYTALTADVTLNRVNTANGTVLSTATATGLSVYKAGSSSDNIFLTDATGSSSQGALNSDGGADTLDMADTNVFSQDISTSIENQSFRVDIILKGTGFEDSDSISSDALGTQIDISA
jgi:hypothetical protein